uniref:Uncharacterized protein n=1 Tax=Oryza glumipatula TaxID=40148 RepID=A0A0D9ZKV7_9ORYZ
MAARRISFSLQLAGAKSLSPLLVGACCSGQRQLAAGVRLCGCLTNPGYSLTKNLYPLKSGKQNYFDRNDAPIH